MILNGTVAASKGEVLCFSTNSFCVCFVFFFCDVTTQRIFTKFSPIFTKSSHGTTMKSHPPKKKMVTQNVHLGLKNMTPFN